ncbi:hypothetical protein K7432_018270 [Basidiobolus ranarum]|uniref:Uncharacterized protein n=1 Tax=Basidiobolus ranarum TaxID=34480 RepID=A0ABR2VJ74_9FUNG
MKMLHSSMCLLLVSTYLGYIEGQVAKAHTSQVGSGMKAPKVVPKPNYAAVYVRLDCEPDIETSGNCLLECFANDYRQTGLRDTYDGFVNDFKFSRLGRVSDFTVSNGSNKCTPDLWKKSIKHCEAHIPGGEIRMRCK